MFLKLCPSALRVCRPRVRKFSTNFLPANFYAFAVLRVEMTQRSIASFFNKIQNKEPRPTVEPVKRALSTSPVAVQKKRKTLRIDSDDSQSPTKSESKSDGRSEIENVEEKVKERKKVSPNGKKSSPKTPKYKINDEKKTQAKELASKEIKIEDEREESHISVEEKLKANENEAEKKPVLDNNKDEAEMQADDDVTMNHASEDDYDPAKSKYHPIKDACWKKNQKIPYLALAKTLEEIEKVSARLKIIEILSNYFRSTIVLNPEDLLPSVYLCLNKLAPAFESVELGIAETTLMKSIAQSTGRTLAQIKTDCNSTGDIGIVAERSRSNQKMMFRPAPLTVRGVFDKLKDIALMSGHAAMTKKADKIQALFVACRHSEARYLIRSLAGKLRIGLAEQSVLQAIALACTMTPPELSREQWPPKILNGSKGLSTEQFKAILDEQAMKLKTAYCECPNYDLVIPTLLKHGIDELNTYCKLTPGIPLKPMLAHPTKGVSEVLQRFENVEFTCEWKYDGERAQIHIPSMMLDGKESINLAAASIYSRNQENNTSKYPDVLSRLSKTLHPSVTSCVLDCEAVAWDLEKKQIRPFQILSTRKRKDAKDSDIKVAVCLFMFDLLYLNGKPLVKKPFEERRRLLKENFVEVEGEWCFATSLDCNNTEAIQEFLEESIRGNCEGLMVKTLSGKDATYEIAKRSRNWLKLKKDYIEGIGDTIDAVVLGGYLGQGKRAGVYGGFLLACYDPASEEYQTLCKIGTGFSDEDLQMHSGQLKEHIIECPRNYYRYDQSLKPDHWFAPVKVWEIKCGDLSLSPVHRAAIGIVDSDKGISLRFPRFIRLRDDKNAEEATSAHQIAELYSNQDQVKNQSQNRAKNHEEDFY